MFDIVEKGLTLDIVNKETNKPITNVYVGAGWDMMGDTPVDLDLIGALLSKGKLVGQSRLVYFGNKTVPGATLSADNLTGEGDGDDESMVIDMTKLESDVDGVALGVVAYSQGVKLSAVQNFKFRIVNGTTANEEQVLEVSVPNSQEKATATVLHAVTLNKGVNGMWTITNVSSYLDKGNGRDAVLGFANLFTA